MKHIDRAAADPEIGGISGTRIHHDGTRIGSPASFDDIECLPTEFTLKYGISGDMAEIWRTDVLRSLPFPVYDDENSVRRLSYGSASPTEACAYDITAIRPMSANIWATASPPP